MEGAKRLNKKKKKKERLTYYLIKRKKQEVSLLFHWTVQMINLF